MRFKRLMNNARWVCGCGALFILGIYVGRFSVLHGWLEGFSVACWFLTVVMWTVPIYREFRREEREFREAMKRLYDEMKGRRSRHENS